ncbi:MAG: 2-oxoglutarate and iron-dependent oxygenase domain-containing protein [Actinomycetota bacterium]|nr:2-oxoglutarate and iron-dependent oxygenase domain-containing protein [Actinomycetota bacterium]
MQSKSLIPLVDLTEAFDPGAGREEAIATLRNACENIGFLVITGHGVQHETISKIETAAREFFSLPHEEKMRCVRGPGDFRGFSPSQASALAQSRDIVTPPDLCEAFSINRFDDPEVALQSGLQEGREAFFAPNLWPNSPESFKDAFETYYAIMEDLAARLMGLMAVALGLDEDWFEDKIDNHITNLTVNHYPDLKHPAEPGQFRRGEHTDWGSLTILYHDGEPGLQIKSPTGEWVDIPIVPGAFVINLGDLMATWTNDRWKSTYHRVVVPSGNCGDRISIAFFHQPAYDAQIECIPTCTSPDDPPHYAPTTSGEWILSMLKKVIYSTDSGIQ